MTSSTTFLVALLPLIVWRVVARFRRHVGRQRSSPVRHWIHIGLFPALILLVGAMTWPHTNGVALLSLGTVAGIALAQYGLRLTHFEPTKQGLFYTPKAWLGILLSVLFVGRILYRIAQVLLIDPHTLAQGNDFMASPLTLTLFGLLAGYNSAYAIGIQRWRQAIIAKAQARKAAHD